MTDESRVPVLVGSGVADQYLAEPGGREAIDLMVAAVEHAALDAGASRLLDRVGWVGVPEGTWGSRDPGRQIADRIGAGSVRSVIAEVGVLQQALIARACERVADGSAEVAVVVGGEAKRRSQLAARAGVDAPEAPCDTLPDVVWKAESLGIADLELARGVTSPAAAFALIETALRADAELDLRAHRALLGDLWARFALVAAGNDHAWDRSAPDAESIITPSATNRMVAEPYTRLLSSQWNVDQAGAVIVCSVETARGLGVAPDRFVFPHASAICDRSIPVSQRVEIHRSPGAVCASARALDLAGLVIDDVAHLDLYSCYPAAVQIYAHALGLSLDRDLTVTGGMTFAGGPLNNYVIQALVRLAHELREDTGSFGLSSSVSGFLAKQGFGIWSTNEAAEGFRHSDVTDEIARDPAAAFVPLEADAEGESGSVAAITVERDLTGTPKVTAIVDLEDARRTIGVSHDDDLATSVAREEWVGSAVSLGHDGELRT